MSEHKKQLFWNQIDQLTEKASSAAWRAGALQLRNRVSALESCVRELRGIFNDWKDAYAGYCGEECACTDAMDDANDAFRHSLELVPETPGEAKP